MSTPPLCGAARGGGGKTLAGAAGADHLTIFCELSKGPYPSLLHLSLSARKGLTSPGFYFILGIMKQMCEWPSSWPRPKPKPKWKQAEDYFKRVRDGKIEITLPQLSCLEDEEVEA